MDDSFDSVKAEIVFFLEKTFQISFGYLGALIALGAGIHFDVAARVGADIHVRARILAIAAFLVLNSIYLTAALGTLFGVLKRGLFLVENLRESRQGRTSVTYRWECFSRNPAPEKGVLRHFWNFDNYYVGHVFLVIVLSSIGIVILGFLEQHGWRELGVVTGATAVQVVPFVAIVAVQRLHARLRSRLELDTTALGEVRE